MKNIVNEARATNVELEKDDLAFTAKKHFERLSDEFAKAPENFEILQRYLDSASLLPVLPFGVDLWKPQNVYAQLSAKLLFEIKDRGDEKSKAWTEKFLSLGEKLGFHVRRN